MPGKYGIAAAKPPVASEAEKPHATKAAMEKKAQEVKAAWGKSNEAALKVGKILMEFEDTFSKVSFKQFVEEMVPFSTGQAYRLIRAYRAFFNVKCDILSRFDLSALYRLSSRGEGHDKARADALKRAAQGKYISDKVAGDIVKLYVTQKRKEDKPKIHKIKVVETDVEKACAARKVDMSILVAILNDINIHLDPIIEA